MTVEEWKRKNPPIQRKPVTNADRIRAMSDEELAKELAAISGYLACPEEVSFWLYWLRQEAKDG
jgi:hypothetical protein